MVLKIEFVKQVIRFVLIGSTAAMVNFSIVIALVESGLLSPLYANIIAFSIAFQVSYFGHRYWTFNRTVNTHKIAVPRLLLISGSSFIANEGIFYIFLNVFQLPYILALFLTLTVLPIVSFTFNKLWVFQEG
ncbi:MAG: GtrA family protein [Pseudomonadota bacterium]